MFLSQTQLRCEKNPPAPRVLFGWHPCQLSRDRNRERIIQLLNRSQMTSKCGKSNNVAHEMIAERVNDVLTTFWRLLWSITELKQRHLRRRGRHQVKLNLYFTSEIRNCQDLFSTPTVVITQFPGLDISSWLFGFGIYEVWASNWPFVSVTSLKWIDRDGLAGRR